MLKFGDGEEEGSVSLSGLIVDQIFYNDENGYGVYRCEPDGQGRMITICGSLGQVGAGEHVELKGEWKDHPRFGEQFLVESCRLCLPSSEEGLVRFLGSGLISGVGPNLAERIVAHFGDRSLEVIENQPERLKEVKGCGPKKRASIVQFWNERKSSKALHLFMSEHGIGLSQAMRMQKAYGDRALEVLKTQPYQMVGQVSGFGFQTVDRLALRLGVGADSPERMGAALCYVLEEASHEGHCHLKKEELLRTTAELLGADEQQVSQALDDMLREKKLVWVGEVILLSHWYRLECAVCEMILSRLRSRFFHRLDSHRLAEVLSEVKMDLAPSQKDAVLVALQNPFCIVTGGPGVGKTTIVRVLVSYWHRLGFEPTLAAPTGRAAQRLEEATGRSATTLHRLLKYQPNVGFIQHAQNQLQGRVFIVDECSMVDLELFHAFLEACPKQAHLIMVGDQDQLPSVGAGRVLGDLLSSGMVPVAVLKKVFRQGGNSLLVHNSHRLIRGELPHLQAQEEAGATGGSTSGLQDFYFVESEDPAHSLKVMRRLILERLPQRFTKWSSRDVQILSPMKKGPMGTIELNRELQKWLNPTGALVREDGQRELRVGDRVVQLVNNYDLDLYNGDMGVISGGDEDHLHIDFDGRTVSYEAEALKDIQLSYAMTVHKSQGSEYPVVLMPIYRGHRMMMSLELLYTALTRARTMCVWIGSWELLQEVLQNPPVLERKTLLGKMLKAAGEEAQA